MFKSHYFPAIAALVVAVAGFAVYANTFDGGWVWDDASSVLLHRHVQEPARLLHGVSSGEVYAGALPGKLLGAFAQLYREDQHAFGRGDGNFYRPLLSTSFAMDYMLAWPGESKPGQPAPEPGTFWFHLQSTLWHVAAALAMLAVLVRLGAPRAVQLAAPLLWVVHPLHTEAVAYISGRADMMSGTFLFLGLYFGLGKRPWEWGLSALCFVLGLLSKEATLLFPLVLAAMIAVRRMAAAEASPASWLRALRPVFYALVVLGVYVALRATVLKFGPGGGGAAAASLGQRLYETLQSLALYAGLMVWPTHLHMERTLDGVGGLAALGGGVVLLVLVAAFEVARRSGHWRIAAGIALFVVCWLPISGVFPLNAPMAEHWMYVPMAGILIALAEAALLLPRAAQLLCAVVAAVFLAGFSGQTMARNEDWDNNVRLFQATLRENPRTMRVHYNLAVTFGDIEQNYAGALRHYAAAAALGGNPPSADTLDAMCSAAAILLDQGRPLEALAIYQKVQEGAQQAPDWIHAEAALGVARAMIALGDVPNAQRAAASAANPAVAAAFQGLATGAPLADSLHLPGLLEERR